MTTQLTFSEFGQQLCEFIGRSRPDAAAAARLSPHLSDRRFNELALALFHLQWTYNAPYREFCRARNISPQTVALWSAIPAVPTTAYKELEWTSLTLPDRTTVFHSTGTTAQKPSRHFHSAESLALYEASLLPWFQAHVLSEIARPESRPPVMVYLTPPAALAPHSSLVHMFETIRRTVASPESLFTGEPDGSGAWRVNIQTTQTVLREHAATLRPVVVLGTAFSFVHLLDHLAAAQTMCPLPRHSCILETGGYKGRSRFLSKTELHNLITRYFDVPSKRIICEYGMSELSSQAYDSVAGDVPGSEFGVQGSRFKVQGFGRVLHFPPWARAQIISPETGEEVQEGETGLIRVCDLANVYSVMAIQTEDLGIRRGDGFELLGRAAQAEPRGCSLLAP